MSAVTYGESYVAAAGRRQPPKKSWFARVLDHMMEARMRQARPRSSVISAICRTAWIRRATAWSRPAMDMPFGR